MSAIRLSAGASWNFSLGITPEIYKGKKMKNKTSMLIASLLLTTTFATAAKDKIHALYIPLADHYPAMLSHHLYAKTMTKADYTVEMMKSWSSLQGKFSSGQADIAFIISPLAMNMYAKKPNFRWVGLSHRDGNAFALSKSFVDSLKIVGSSSKEVLATKLAYWTDTQGKKVVIGVPAIESTHSVVLYKFFKDHGIKLNVNDPNAPIALKVIAPPNAPAFLESQNSESNGVAIEQSMPWITVAQENSNAQVVWTSKQIIETQFGHVECIIIATDDAIKNKRDALAEVLNAIHLAADQLQNAIDGDDQKLSEFADVIQKNYVQSQKVEYIKASLSKQAGIINYRSLDNDHDGLKQIMDLAVEARIMDSAIDITSFADDSFSHVKN